MTEKWIKGLKIIKQSNERQWDLQQVGKGSLIYCMLPFS